MVFTILTFSDGEAPFLTGLGFSLPHGSSEEKAVEAAEGFF